MAGGSYQLSAVTVQPEVSFLSRTFPLSDVGQFGGETS